MTPIAAVLIFVSTRIKRNQNVDIRSKMGHTPIYRCLHEAMKKKKGEIEFNRKRATLRFPFILIIIWTIYEIFLMDENYKFTNRINRMNRMNRSPSHNGIVFIFPFQPFTLSLNFIEMSFCIHCVYVSHTHYNIDKFNRSMVDGAQLSIEH